MTKGLLSKSVFVYSTEKDTDLTIELVKITSIEKLKIVQNPGNGVAKIVRSKLQYTPKGGYVGTDFLLISNKVSHQSIIVIKVENTVFKPRARLLIQLGNQLIKNESIALIELVKNSYDADASFCKIYMQNVESKNTGKIIIEDDGQGMGIDTVKNSWLEPGSDAKAKIVADVKYSKKGRLPIGEKGIGRFGVHKLGKRIELVSRQLGSKEVVVEIDWDDFEKHKYLNQAPVVLYERKPIVFTGEKSGTKITIGNLSKVWTRGMVRDVFRAINAISVPFTYEEDKILQIEQKQKELGKGNDVGFDAQIITNHSEWIKDIPSWRNIIEYGLFFFEIEIEHSRIIKISYQFKPWENMKGLKPRKVTEKDSRLSKLLEIMDPDEKKPVSLKIPHDLRIGKVYFKGCIFIRDLPILKLFTGKNPSIVKEYLDENGGIRIYRGNMRIYDYGERENDWLDLDYRRFNDPGVKISNNLMLASISLGRESSKDLIEKTNREGFIDNEAYHIFKKQILYSLKLIELLRSEDKKKIDEIYKRKSRKFEPVLKSIENLKAIVQEKIKNTDTRKEIIAYVNTIEKNYKFMNDTMVKSASVGLGWGIYIHEIEKIISEISKISKREKSSDRLLNLITHLANLIESYAQVLRKAARTNEDLVKIIDQALFNVEFRLKAHNIKVIAPYKKHTEGIKVKVTRNLIIANIMNLIDNSIYWLDRSGRKDKKISLDIKVSEVLVSIVVCDNGCGFALSPEEMVEPFVSAKPGGMGLGLHIIKEVMEGQSGSLTFNEDGFYKVGSGFKSGATVLLNFKKTENLI